MKVVVAGCRHFEDREYVFEELDFFLNKYYAEEDIEIISGGARGVDTIAKAYAEERAFPFEEFPADWKNFGKYAGPLRNRQMASQGDVLIAFLAHGSKGTANMIKMMKAADKPLHIVNI